MLTRSLSMLLAIALLITPPTASAQPQPPAPPSYADQLDAFLRQGLTPDQVSRSEALDDEIVAIAEAIDAINEDFSREALQRPEFAGVEPSKWFVDVSQLFPTASFQPEARDLAAAREVLERYEASGLFARLNIALEAPRTAKWRTWRNCLAALPLDSLSAIRRIAQACTARMIVAAGNGEVEKAADSFDMTLRLAGVTSDGSALMIERLVSISVHALAVNQARSLMTNEAGAELARAFADRMDRFARLPDGPTFFEAERAFSRAWIEHDGRLARARFAGPGYLRALDDYFDIAARRAGMTYRERRADPFDEEKWLEGRARWWSTIDNDLRYLAKTEKVLDNLDQIRCESLGLRAMIAIECFRADHGAPPVALAALIPKYLPALQSDPYAEGAPLRYLRIDPADDALRRDYLLYSVGADGTDNNGVPPPGDEPFDAYQATSGACSNCDFIINRSD